MPAPTNDNWANATVITGTTGTSSGTTVGASMEVGEPAPIGGSETVWYKINLPATTSMLPVDMWFCTAGAPVGMVIQVFQQGSPDTLANITECTYDNNHSHGLGYTTDAGVSVLCTPGVNYYIRVASRVTDVDGAFLLVYDPYQVMSLGSCANCPPKFGTGGCLEQLLGSVTISNPTTSSQASFGSLPAGRYTVRYCHGAFYAWAVYLGGTDTRPYPIGWFVTNQELAYGIGSTTLCLNPHTIVIYNNPSVGADPGVSGSPVASWGTIATFNIPLENTGCVANLIQTGPSLASPIQFTGTASWTGGIPAYSTYANLLNVTQGEAESWARCGAVQITHLGGPIYLSYVIEDLYPYLTTYANISGSVTWGLYQVTPTFNATGFSVIETDTTTTGGATDNNSSFSPVTPGPNLTTATFYFTNIGELAYTGVTVTLTGVTSPSAPQMINIPLGSNSVTFSFETPTTATTAVLSFTDAIGETFPVLSYNAAEFLIINTPTATAEPTCPTTITQFTFPIKNVGTLASAAGTRVDISFFACTTGGSDPGNVLGAGCATTGAGAAKTMILGAIAAGSTVNAFIECLNQPHGVVMTWKIALSGPGLSNVPPDYYFTYTWP